MAKGYLLFVLQAHLPFVRHPDHEDFLEERWLFEAVSETYLPLLRVFRNLEKDNIPFKLTFSFSPTLTSMLADPLLQDRYIRHTEKLIELAEREIERTKPQPEFQVLARMYKSLYETNLADFRDFYQKNILRGFRHFQKTGNINIITTAATHCFLPLYSDYPETIAAQISVGLGSHNLNFCKPPRGIWIPECGYFPGLEDYLAKYDLQYFFTAAHGLLFASERPRYGLYAPVRTPNGVFAFGRDLSSAEAVWSAEEGYPGDSSYRDFYRDIGFDLPIEYLRPYLCDGKIRISTGLKYHAVTGKTEDKRPYHPEEAEAKIRDHAENFLYNRMKQVQKIAPHMDRPPVLVCPYDAELFGHWWFEGPRWLETVLRKLAAEYNDLEAVLPEEYLEAYPDNQAVQPAYSSWGNKGYAEVWLDSSNDWIYRHTHGTIERMYELVNRFPDEKGLKERALNQAMREMLLSQASDWPFIMKTGTTVGYATRRFKEHIHNFNKIYSYLCRNTVQTEWLTRIEKKNNIFPNIDYRIFLRKEKDAEQ